ncbi:hypothetical protein DM01DRAFT_1332598 [Hesseltinella vesiculosa]|uniref:Uncharacterized protein n=1 Tax=Hesseltinella vesiculosa TaxID=101127 RepID=A0A1X2GSL2_9FUNG|nr:hypothetical protein DM01DRAFT_1332598 [Hesseltinella vesiculosa]
MPFRCKCGRTFEKPDSFASHTSACASFHSRRVSDIATTGIAIPTRQQPPPPPSDAPSTAQSLPGLSTLSFFPPTLRSPPSSPTDHAISPLAVQRESAPFFLPTGLSIQDAFEGARRRSMSSGSTNNRFK